MSARDDFGSRSGTGGSYRGGAGNSNGGISGGRAGHNGGNTGLSTSNVMRGSTAMGTSGGRAAVYGSGNAQTGYHSFHDAAGRPMFGALGAATYRAPSFSAAFGQAQEAYNAQRPAADS